MAYTAGTPILNDTLITKALWDSDHYGNWSWLSTFTVGGKTLADHTLPLTLGANPWHCSYEPGADFATVAFDVSAITARFAMLRVVGANLRTDVDNWSDFLLLSFNNDKTNTYYYSWARNMRDTPNFSSWLASQPGLVIWGATGATAAANCWGCFDVCIYQPQPMRDLYPVVKIQSWVLNTVNNQIVATRGGGHYYQTGVIDRIDLDPVAGPNFVSGGAGEPTTRIDIYGYLGAEG